MEEKDIFFILIQIDEAHTPSWPQGEITLGAPQANIEDRRSRAATFAKTELAGKESRFAVVVDPWHNPFANRYRAWPDKYYLLNSSGIVLMKSTYGSRKDAVIDMDCVDVIKAL